MTEKIDKLYQATVAMHYMQLNPNLYNEREVHKRYLESLGLANIDELLLPKQEILPLDPLSENCNALQNKPLKAAEWQDHKAHVTVHQSILQRPEVQKNPTMIQAIMEHINVHNMMQHKIDNGH